MKYLNGKSNLNRPLQVQKYLIDFKWYVTPSGVILCLEIRKLYTLYVYIYIFV